MSQASSSAASGSSGAVTFGPRDGGNTWVVVAILVGGALVALLIWSRKGK